MRHKLMLVVVIAISVLLFTAYVFEPFGFNIRTEEVSPTVDNILNREKNLKFGDLEGGEKVRVEGVVVNATYGNNVTEVWLKSVNRPIYFNGDLTRNWFILPNTIIGFNITVMERREIHLVKQFYTPTETRKDVEILGKQAETGIF